MAVISTRSTNFFFDGIVIPGSVKQDYHPGTIRAIINLDDEKGINSFFETLNLPKEIYTKKPISTIIDIAIPNNNRSVVNELSKLLRTSERRIIGVATVLMDNMIKTPDGLPAIQLLLQVQYPEFLLVSDSEIIKPKTNNKKKLKVNFKNERK